ncbi:MAG: glycine--tRNA ligase [Nanoarchaeota archaeon]|nr:glycine--tRNA ligase [Nanoarchaeota archaeon]
MVSIEEMAVFCKRKGFVFPSSEIHGGLAGFFDYGPLGVEMKNNIKRLWWKSIVNDREDVVGIDGALISPESVWKASGHVENFIDKIGACKKCKTKVKLDKHEIGIKKCEKCGIVYADEGELNPMFETSVGSTGVKDKVYLRPETAQMIYVNFKNVLDTSRMKIPFGIAQVGKAFRNEISPRNFLFRMREFDQMELQYFVREKNAAKIFKEWKKIRMDWYISLGIDKKKLRFKEHDKKDLAHYAKEAFDIEFEFDEFGWQEIEGLHNRGDWDLSQHEKFSKQDLKYFDDQTKEKFIPWVVETSSGLDRAFLTFMFNAYVEEEVKGEKRIVLKLHPDIAPFRIAILPLVKKDGLAEKGREIFDELKTNCNAFYDDRSSVGRRYRRMDEIGTKWCITVDYQTLEDSTVTIRERDTMRQVRAKIKDLPDIIKKLSEGEKLETFGNFIK